MLVYKGGEMKVPEGGLESASIALQSKVWTVTNSEGRRDTAMLTATEAEDIAGAALEAFIRWQSETPPVPTTEQIDAIERFQASKENDARYLRETTFACAEWVRRMYLAPEPEAPKFVECDTCRAKPGSPTLCAGCLHNREVIESLTRRATQESSEAKPTEPKFVLRCFYCGEPLKDKGGEVPEHIRVEQWKSISPRPIGAEKRDR